MKRRLRWCWRGSLAILSGLATVSLTYATDIQNKVAAAILASAAKLGAPGADIAVLQRSGNGCFDVVPTAPPLWAMQLDHYVTLGVAPVLAMLVAVIVYHLVTFKLFDYPHCYRCGYMLRGVAEPRCPECGQKL